MEAKSTDELIQIWRENDRTQYVDEAFEAIRQLLKERGETVPPQLPATTEKKSSPGIPNSRTTASRTGL